MTSTSSHGLWSWVCVVYCILLVAIGTSMPITFGIYLIENPLVNDYYLDFYSFLYGLGLVLLTIHFFVGKRHIKIINSLKLLPRKLLPKRKASAIQVNGHEQNDHQIKQHEESVHGQKEEKISTGRLGIKFGIKISFIVLVTMVLIELSTYISIKLEDPECDYAPQTTNFALFCLYIIFQTWFVLNTTQESMEENLLMSKICVAHQIATTICLGFFLTTQDCLLKLFYLYFSLQQEEHEVGTQSTVEQPVSLSTNDIEIQRYKRSEEDSHTKELNVTNPCSLENYINHVNRQMKPFSYHFTMFYVYCCGILLILLFLHLRKKIYSQRSDGEQSFFKIMNTKSATFSAGAGLSLIVLSIITSILTIQSSSNIFIIVFLILLHGQATVAAFLALLKISNVPCALRKDSSKYATIFLIFYFFVILVSVFEAITRVYEAKDEQAPIYVFALQVAVEILDVLQAFFHGVLILIGFYTTISQSTLRNYEMPLHILIHLAATNMASLLSSIFVSENKVEKLAAMFKAHDDLADTNTFIAWTVIDSILAPAEEFSRFFTVICLVKLYKIWSPREDLAQHKSEISRL